MNNESEYVFQFRGPVRSELCSILDLNDKWRELAAWLGYSARDLEHIDRIARNRSPSDVLLELWGQRAPTMHKLFIALSEIQHYQALMLLKDFVPEEFHVLIYEGEENLDTKDNGDGTEAECFSSSESNNIVNQNGSASKQLNSKMIDISRATAIRSTSNKKETCQPLATTHTRNNEILNTGDHSPRVTWPEQQEDPGFPHNVIDHEAHVNGMFHSITEEEDVASVGTVNQSHAHTELAITAPPACFVPPEVINAPTSNSPVFNGCASFSPWFNSEPYCKSIISQVECPRINTSAPNPNGLEKNKTLPESTFFPAAMPSSEVNTFESASGPARRVLGSSLASKKLMLGAL